MTYFIPAWFRTINTQYIHQHIPEECKFLVFTHIQHKKRYLLLAPAHVLVAGIIGIACIDLSFQVSREESQASSNFALCYG